MPRISTDNYDTVASWNGAQDLFIVEQPDGTKVATPAMVKQFIEAGDFEATGEVKDGHGNILKDMAKSADVSTISAKHTITTTTSGVTINRGEYFTLGKLVFVSLDVTTTVSATFATLPKPVSQVNVLNCDYPNNANGTFFQLNPNGTLEVYRSGAASARCIANLIYLSNDV